MNAAQALEISNALVELKNYIEGRFPPGPRSSGRFSVTGEEHTELCGEPRQEGEAIPVYPTMEAAMAAARAHFDKYAEGRSGRVYWRMLPEIQYFPPTFSDEPYGWKFYMRLLVSDKPAKED